MVHGAATVGERIARYPDQAAYLDSWNWKGSWSLVLNNTTQHNRLYVAKQLHRFITWRQLESTSRKISRKKGDF
jgi:hypothetical protein